MAYFPEIYEASPSGQIGFIQGPEESDLDFAKRIEVCSSIKDPKADEHLLGWIPLYYTNQGLSFFEGGATFIEEKEGIVRPIIHLKKAFKHKSIWLFYDKEEILHHELIHAMRCKFNEPGIEEFLAYQTSKVAYRKYFGPLFNSTKKTFFFLGLLMLPVLFLNPALYFFPGLALVGLIAHLAIKQYKFKKLLTVFSSFEERIRLRDLHFKLKIH